MKKLSIILSLFVAVAVAAIAAVTVGASSRAATQGYWITLTLTQSESDNDNVRFLSVVNSPLSPVGTVKEEAPSNSSYWHAEPVANSDTKFYLVDNNGRYLTVTLKQEASGDYWNYFYKVAVANTQSGAAEWNINASGPTEIKLAEAPASVKAQVDGIKDPNTMGSNIYLASAANIETVWMADRYGSSPEQVDNLSISWTITTAEQRYESALKAADVPVQALLKESQLWSNKSVNENAQKTIDGFKSSTYDNLRGPGAKPATVIANMESSMAQVYNTVYNSIPEKVVTLTGSKGYLSVDDLKFNDNVGLDELWTIKRQGNGYVIYNQTADRYVALIPAVPAHTGSNWETIPAVPAHFGVSPRATVLTIKPVTDGVTFYAGEQPLYFPAAGAELDPKAEPAVFSVGESNAESVSNIVINGQYSQFVKEKGEATAFLSTLSSLDGTSGNDYDDAIKTLNNLTGEITVGENTTAMWVLTEAKRQLQRITDITNGASMTPVLLQASNTSLYLSAAAIAEDGFNSYGNPVKIDVPDARMTTVYETARSLRLATAFWAFRYAGNGKCYLVNEEGLYLAPGVMNADVQREVNATEDLDEATLFTIGAGSFSYTDAEGNNKTFSIESDGVSYNSFAIANPAKMPAPSVEGSEKYFQIASVGGGGVISGQLPGEALTRTGSTIGSYWWIETDDSDPVNDNAYLIHSIFPGYYLGADLKLSDKPCTWYINENGITPAQTTDIDKAFNGYNAGLVISTTPANDRGSVIAAAPYTNAGAPDPAIRTQRFAASSWQLQSWTFVEADDAEQIVADYIDNNLRWQVTAVKEGLDAVAGMIPFGSNALVTAQTLVDEFWGDIQTAQEKPLDAILEFSNLMKQIQADFDDEVLDRAPGCDVRIVNEGRNFYGSSADVFLAGSGSNLTFVPFDDKTPGCVWTIGANGTKGLTFTNGNYRTLGAPTAGGSISSATGTYRLSIDIWWDVVEERDGYYTSTGASQPWYSVPQKLIDAPEAAQEDYYNNSVRWGIGLENVAAPGVGLAATDGSNNSLCGSDLNNIWAQWSFVIYTKPSGIDEIESAEGEAEEVALFNLQGQRVNRASAAPGIYLSRRSDGSVVKVTVK